MIRPILLLIACMASSFLVIAGAVSLAQPVAHPTDYHATAAQVVQKLEPVPMVDCADSAGTAFRIGQGLLLSVQHVTKAAGCTIDGAPIRVIYSHADFSMLADDRSGEWLKVDCGGFVRGHQYYAVGHARGLEALAIVPLIATGSKSDGYAVLMGVFTVQPGQSGGPIIDAVTHEVVGVVNAANWEDGTTFSTELRDTSVCKGRTV